MKILLLLCPLMLFAGFVPLDPEDYSIEHGLGVGYRYDRFGIKYRQAFADGPPPAVPLDNYRANYKKIRSIDVDLFLEALIKQFYLRCDFDYGWILSGDYRSGIHLPINNGQRSQEASFSAGLGGKVFDIIGSGGLELPLYKSDCYHVSVIPFAGYGLMHMRVTHKNVQPDPFDIDPIFDPNFQNASISISLTRIKRSWWGPHLGAALKTKLGCHWLLDLAYYYTWAQFKQDHKIHNDFRIGLAGPPFPPFGPNLLLFTNQILSYSLKKTYGHSARGKASYQFDEHWMLGLTGKMSYFRSGIKTVNVILQRETAPPGLIPDPPEETEQSLSPTHWFTYSILLEVSFKH